MEIDLFEVWQHEELCDACRNGDIPTVIRLIKFISLINVENKLGFTPLLFASLYGYKEICELLIKNGADVNAKSCNKSTPLIYASMFCPTVIGRKEICELLIKNGADVNLKNNFGHSALKQTIFYRNHQICELLIENNAEIEINDESFKKILENDWADLCLKVMRKKSFEKRKHLLQYYYSF